MSLLWVLWEICVNSLECYFLFYMLSRQLDFYPGGKKYAYLGLLAIIIIETTLNFTHVESNVVIVVCSIIKLIYPFVCFSDKIPPKILWGIIGIFVPNIANLILSNILPLISGLNIVDTLSPSMARFGVQIFYILVVIILYWILSQIPRKNKISLSPAIQIISIGIVAIGIFSVAEIVGFSINAERTPDERRILIIISFAILVMMTAIILLFDKMGSAIWKKLDAEHRLQLFTMEKANIKRSKEMIRTWNHDFKNALEILRYYAVRGDLENIKKYIGILQSGYEEIKAEQSTGYSSVDAIISMKLMVAHTKEIPISLNISQIDNLPINESDFSMILGNLLDNAIEACEKVEIPDNRYIDVAIYKQQDMIRIGITNSSIGDYQYKNNKLISSKKVGDHGHGLSRMNQVIKRCGGFYKTFPENDSFELQIFIPTTSEEKCHED